MTHLSSETADQDSAGKRLRKGRDSVSMYLESRGLAGLTIPCQVNYYRQVLERRDEQKDGRRTHRTKLAVKITALVLKQLVRVSGHIFTVLGKSALQILTKTTMQTLRTTPVTLAAIILLFLTSDAWKICGKEGLEQVIVILVVVLAISVLFFFIGSDNKFRHWTSDIFPDPEQDDLGELAKQTTPGAKDLTHLDLMPGDRDLGRLGRINARTIYVALIIVNFMAVGFWAALALIFFGILIFSEQAQGDLMGGIKDVHPIINHPVAGYPVAITWQLLLVSFMLAGIAVLSFAATGLQDAHARDAFVQPNIKDLKSCISAFYFYRAAVRIVGAGGGPDEPSPSRETARLPEEVTGSGARLMQLRVFYITDEPAEQDPQPGGSLSAFQKRSTQMRSAPQAPGRELTSTRWSSGPSPDLPIPGPGPGRCRCPGCRGGPPSCHPPGRGGRCPRRSRARCAAGRAPCPRCRSAWWRGPSRR